MTQNETILHQQVCDYLRLQYPDVYFRTDFAAGTKLTMGQAVRNKRLQKCRAWPDLFIAEPRHGKHGLFIELKDENETVFLRNGTLTTNQHITDQAAILELLTTKGYEASFGIGFDKTIEIISRYLSHA